MTYVKVNPDPDLRLEWKCDSVTYDHNPDINKRIKQIGIGK